MLFFIVIVFVPTKLGTPDPLLCTGFSEQGKTTAQKGKTTA